jgi:5-methyltetrahydropteroyltriglutamate--homocysteine methyltransferase
MVKSCDEGSLPFVGDFQAFSDGASNYGRVTDDSTVLFENKVLTSFFDKVEAGIDVPNYPQYRDMNQMMFDMIDGIGKIDGGYVETASLTLKEGKSVIPEVSVIKNHSQEIYEKLGKPFQLRVCVTGPYTLSSLFDYKDKNTFTRLGNVLTQIVEANILNSKQGNMVLVSVDEPVFGFVDDPLLDRGSEGRESLLKAWESITQKIRAKGAQSCLHLHNTSDELFWEVQDLNMIESHFHDLFYQAKRTKERLESTDKFLKASIAVTDFDQLIRNIIVTTAKQKMNDLDVNEKIAETWKTITKNQLDPTVFVENAVQMKKRLVKMVEFFGENRVPYAGPECGLKGFPTYESAIECLKRVAKAVKTASN